MAPGSRRQFLGVIAVAIVSPLAGRSAARGDRAQGLGQFAGGPPPCKADEKPTPAAPQGADYRPNSPQRTSLIEPDAVGTRLVLTGTISGLTCGPIQRAVADFWQADPNGAYDKTGFHFRGRQFTDANGRYRLETLVPGSAAGHAPRIHVRVQPPKGTIFTTQLFISGDPRNGADAAFQPELAMKMTDDGKNGKAAVFDIVLNI
jgi:protocatechuate 3,4-dioxygenase beta subunit